MADTKKSGNSIVWSWREVGVENCTCMSVEAGMYCGPERTPGIANDSPLGTSCGHHCWDLGYVDAETEYFISKGFPVCGGPDAPPLPDPILWPEFPLDNLNRDGVPPCQHKATARAFKQNIHVRFTEQQNLNPPKPVILPRDAGACLLKKLADDLAIAKGLSGCYANAIAGAETNYNACAVLGATIAQIAECRAKIDSELKKDLYGTANPPCNSDCQNGAFGGSPSPDWAGSCDGLAKAARGHALDRYNICLENTSSKPNVLEM